MTVKSAFRAGDLTQGGITGTIIVGRFVGAEALAAIKNP